MTASKHGRTVAAVLMLSLGAAAAAADTFNAADRQLTMQSVAIGSATYGNMVVTVGDIVSGPSGSAPSGAIDRYDPGTNQLTVQAVTLGTNTYFNVVVTVAGLVSIGSVSGADSYDGGDLSISLVQLGGTVYDRVVVAEGPGNVISVAGGMPTDVPDTYNPLTNELAIPAIQAGNRVYTNVIVSVGTLLGVGGVASAAQESLLYSFGTGGSTEGFVPYGSLVQGSDGNFYGTTNSGGGLLNNGTVFRVTPGGVETVLHSFNEPGSATYGADGYLPVAGLILASDGNFYGTTEMGGPSNSVGGTGTVFRISATDNYAETVLYYFTGDGGVPGSKDGAHPEAGLIEGSDGNFYGTTFLGGTYNQGTVFKVTPSGNETVLYSFQGNVSGSTDGAQPQAGVIFGRDGNLYGTTYQGGTHNLGTVFQLTPSGIETVLHSFAKAIGGASDGGYPTAGLVQGNDGNFYGTTSVGGATNGGTVYRITPGGEETVIYSFSEAQNSTDGYGPAAGLILASDGNFYGTTKDGGVDDPGTVFKITPDGVETVVHSFLNGTTDGQFPQGGVLQAADGNFYGTTLSGGAYGGGAGAVFRLSNVIAGP
jgi:uncharacterized repeat protein (TIGR03803 family)